MINNTQSNKNTVSHWDVVIHHYPCQDGLFSAYVAKMFNDSHGDNKEIEFYGTQPGKDDEYYDFPDVTGKNVLIADISFRKDIMIKLNNVAAHLVCLDHHKTAKEQLTDLDFCIFDMSRSGCQMVWDYLFPKRDRPLYIDYIGGRDLWDFSLENTREFTTGFWRTVAKDQKQEFSDVMKLIDEFNTDDETHNKKIIAQYIKFGAEQLEIVDMAVRAICRKAVKCTVLGKTAYAVNSRVHISDVGNTLLKMYDDCEVAILYEFDLASNSWFISLRGIKDSVGVLRADVSALAKNIDENGGGHACAAGCSYKGDISRLFVTDKMANMSDPWSIEENDLMHTTLDKMIQTYGSEEEKLEFSEGDYGHCEKLEVIEELLGTCQATWENKYNKLMEEANCSVGYNMCPCERVYLLPSLVTATCCECKQQFATCCDDGVSKIHGKFYCSEIDCQPEFDCERCGDTGITHDGIGAACQAIDRACTSCSYQGCNKDDCKKDNLCDKCNSISCTRCQDAGRLRGQFYIDLGPCGDCDPQGATAFRAEQEKRFRNFEFV